MRDFSNEDVIDGCVACFGKPALPKELMELERAVGDKQRSILFDPDGGGPSRSIVTSASDNETVLGPSDDLEYVANSRVAPWSMICRLECRFPDYDPNIRSRGMVIGTGWFAGDQTVITAGHCIYDHRRGGWAERISVTQGYAEGNPDPDRTELVTESLSVLRNWVETASEPHDLGCIHLKKSLGRISAARSFAAATDVALENQQIFCAGYPLYGSSGYSRVDETARDGKKMFFASDLVASLTSNRIFHKVDTFKGMSGGPIWKEGRDFEHPPVIVGIHTDGTDSSATGLEKKFNAAVRIDAAIFRKIQAWKAQKGGVENLEDVTGLRSMDRRNHRNSVIARVTRTNLEVATPGIGSVIPPSVTQSALPMPTPRVPPTKLAWLPWAGASVLLVSYLAITFWMMSLASDEAMKDDAIWRRLTDIQDGFMPVAIAAIGFLLGIQIQERRTANAVSDANAARELAGEAGKRADETEARGHALREMIDASVAAKGNESAVAILPEADLVKAAHAAFPPC